MELIPPFRVNPSLDIPMFGPRDVDCEASVKVLFRRQVYSNSSAGLEKSSQGVPNTPPSPIFGVPASPDNGFVGKEVFTFKKILPGRRGKLERDKGIEDRVSSKI
jgi:hypothetical protein